MVLNLRIAHYSQTMDIMNAQMNAIDDVFFYSGMILMFNVLMSLTLKSNRNLER